MTPSGELRAVVDPGMPPSSPTSEDELLAAYYHEKYPGLKRDFFDFLRNVSQMEKEILSLARILTEHQSKFESKTVVYTRQELFAHLCARGYTEELATSLTENADEDIIPHWTLSQWTVAFLSYATKSWSNEVASRQAESQSQPQDTSSSFPIGSHSKEVVHLSDLKVQLDKVKKESSHLVFFHFTTQAAALLIQEGIELRRSNRQSEFAVAGAFHLSDSIEYGLKWLRTRYPSEKWAVLVFEVPASYFQQHRYFHFETANDEWKKFCYVNFNEDPRRWRQQQLEKDNDIIAGPICKFRATSPAHPDHTTVEPFLDANQNMCIQYAIVKQSAAENLMNYLIKSFEFVV